MPFKQPQQLSFVIFRERATIQSLKGHGRTASVNFGDRDLGFVDALGEPGLRQAHKREVKNALYFNFESISSERIKPALPTSAALIDYPDLVRAFPAAASILGFFVERDYLGSLSARYCFPNDDQRKTLKYVLEAYGYLIERNERISLLEFAERIGVHYDVAEVRNRIAVDALRMGAGVNLSWTLPSNCWSQP